MPRAMGHPTLLLCFVIFVGAATTPVSATDIDFIVLLDVSESMLPYFDDTVYYLIRDILSLHLEPGDRFHFISFANTPEIELATEIQEDNQVESILSRILLLQPLGRYTDLVFAFNYLYTYARDLSASSKKRILILTDGIQI